MMWIHFHRSICSFCSFCWIIIYFFQKLSTFIVCSLRLGVVYYSIFSRFLWWVYGARLHYFVVLVYIVYRCGQHICLDHINFLLFGVLRTNKHVLVFAAWKLYYILFISGLLGCDGNKHDWSAIAFPSHHNLGAINVISHQISIAQYKPTT